MFMHAIGLINFDSLFLQKKKREKMKSLPPNTLKKMLEEVLIDMLKNRKKEVYNVILDTMEDYGLSHAIKEGRKNKFVDETKIIKVLAGSR